ncbi:phosphatase PAP2 family protein [Sphingomonas sp. ID0503]|uniref:phosphatase PAP2 family protein n=1 Tax=Sphingomonas sp. ID0503 TaxID=3399691 RepID=UPI003AFA0A7C
MTGALVAVFSLAAAIALCGVPAERDLFLSIHSLGSPTLIPLTRLGNFVVLGPLALAVAAWLLWRRRFLVALWLLATCIIARAAAALLKLAFGRPRPDLAEHLDRVHSLSFPSAHATNTMATFLAIALALRLPLWPAVLLSLVVGVSRVALGVHWPSDVAGGWALGALVVLLNRAAFPAILRR